MVALGAGLATDDAEIAGADGESQTMMLAQALVGERGADGVQQGEAEAAAGITGSNAGRAGRERLRGLSAPERPWSAGAGDALGRRPDLREQVGRAARQGRRRGSRRPWRAGAGFRLLVVGG